jgi:hypothetical protein
MIVVAIEVDAVEIDFVDAKVDAESELYISSQGKRAAKRSPPAGAST